MASIRNALRLMRSIETDPSTSTALNTQVGIRSPWSTGLLAHVTFADLFGIDTLPVSRSEAMSLPAVARGRHLLVSTIAGLPLRTFRGGEELVDQPPWLYRTGGRTSPQHRLAGIVDDLIFGGWSLLAVERDGRAQITDAARVHPDLWGFGSEGQVLVNEQEVTEDSVVLIPGMHEGVLSFGARTIRQARHLEDQTAQRAGSPIPVVELHQNTDDELDETEIKAMLDAYRTARLDPNGAAVYTPSSIDLKVHGQQAVELLIQGRNAAAIDTARLLGIPAAMIDASNVNSSLTYETLQGRSLEFASYSLALYTTPISARLSMDDVTPRGTRIAFDTSTLTVNPPSPSGAPLED